MSGNRETRLTKLEKHINPEPGIFVMDGIAIPAYRLRDILKEIDGKTAELPCQDKFRKQR
jgi:hypothetical protein